MKPSVIVVFLLAMALLAGTVVQAEVIFDNFGPGDAYNVIPSCLAQYETDWVFTGGGLYNQDCAVRFGSVATTRYLTSVDLPISNAGPTDTAYIYLMSGSPEPTALVDFAVYTGLPTYTGIALPPISVPFDSYELAPGVTYWIVVSTVDIANSAIRWGSNPIGMTGANAINLTATDNPSMWTLYENGATSAMRVNVELQAVSTEAASWGGIKALYR